VKTRFTQGLWWEVRTEVREHDTPSLSLELLVHYAQRRVDICRRHIAEQQAYEARWEKARQNRRALRPTTRGFLTAAVQVPSKVREAHPDSTGQSPLKVGEAPRAQWTLPPPKTGGIPGPPARGSRGTPRYRDGTHMTCLACDATTNLVRNSPRLDAATKAQLRKALEVRSARRRGQGATESRGRVVAAVGTSAGLVTISSPGSSSPKNAGVADLYLDETSSKGNAERGDEAPPSRVRLGHPQRRGLSRNGGVGSNRERGGLSKGN